MYRWHKLNSLRVRYLLFVIVFISFVAVGAGCSLLPQEEEALPPPLFEPVRESLRLHEVGYGKITKSVRGMGSVESTRHVYHELTRSQRLLSVEVKPGQMVEEGDVLIQFDAGTLEEDILRQKIKVEHAQINLENAQSSGDLRMVRIRLMELEAERMRLEDLEEQLDNSQLTAQISGQVIFVEQMMPGDRVEAFRPLVGIADPNELRIAYEVSNPIDIIDVKVGMEANVTFRDAQFVATVVQTPSSAPPTPIDSLAERYARTLYLMPAEGEDWPDIVGMGVSVQIEIITEQKENTLVIPKNGLRSYLGRDYVQVLDGEVRREVDVETGIEGATEWEIVSGLEEGQMIILR